MSLRKAADRLGAIPFVVYGAVLWTVLIGVYVGTTMLPATAETGAVGQYVGQTFYTGVVGIAVLAVLAGGLLYLVSEMRQDGPVPETFPPER